MNKKGFTLIEVIMIIVLLGIIMPGIMLYFMQGVKESAIPQRRTTAVFLAEALMEEIKSKRWDETAAINSDCSNATAPASLGLDGGETRQTYDDIDDFNNVSGVTPPQNSQGVSLGTAYQGFSQTVTVYYVDPAVDLNTNAGARTCYKRIRVDITDSATNETISLVSLMTYY